MRVFKTNRNHFARHIIQLLLRLMLMQLVIFSSVSLAQDQPPLLLRNATIITGDGQQIAPGSVLIEDSLITAVGATGTIDFPADAVVVDLTGKFLLPALIDAHAHLGFQSPHGWGSEFYNRDNLLANLQQYAFYGFSAVFSAGSDPAQLALALQAEFAQEQVSAARFLFAAGMGPPGQGPNDAFLIETGELEERMEMTILRGVDGPVQGIERAREVAEQGIPFIKIWVDDRGGSQQKLSPESYLPLVAEGMRQRLKTFAHQQYATDMLPLIDAGVSGFLHGRLGPDLNVAVSEALARERVFTVPNLGLGELRRETIGSDPFLQSVLPGDEVERLSQRQPGPQNSLERDRELAEAMQRLVAAGADIVLGTDAGALPDHPFGYTGHRELEIFVRLGLTPMQAIIAATSNAALHLGQNDLGLVAPGRRADLLILDADPLADIRNTRQINSVYIGGSELDRAEIAAQLSSEL